MKSGIVGCLFAAALSIAAAHAAEPNVVSCKVITKAAQLQAINTNANTLAGTYCLGSDIDLSSIANWTPIGGATPFFSGQFYGKGHVVRNLTIHASTPAAFGLFGTIVGGTVRDVGLVNVNISGAASGQLIMGALAAVMTPASSPIFISGVYSTGQVKCSSATCAAGGLFGTVPSSDAVSVTDAWSSADVGATSFAGGVAALYAGSTFHRIYATGNVTGSPAATAVGGLAGLVAGNPPVGQFTNVDQAYATGQVTGGTNTATGGLIGSLGSGGALRSVYATGAVTGSGTSTIGGLVGTQQDGAVIQAFSAGAVSGGATRGGLIGAVSGGPSISNAYWDSVTSGQATSAGGSAKTTAQLRAALPAGFTPGWGITKAVSYPYLSDPDNFTSTLATLVVSNKVFAFLPIEQSDKSQYIGNPSHTDQASLAAVYTMIARSIGITDNVAALKGVKIDKYFWHDATQTTTFTGPVNTRAALGAMTAIAPGARLNGPNVLGQMNVHRLVILRGTYTTTGGGTATHYMLGTLYTRFGQAVVSVVANDPFTGAQVEISPTTKMAVSPSNFPLANFKVNAYQAVTVN